MIQKLNSSFLNNLVHLMNLMIDFMYVPDYKSANFLIDSLLAESKKRNLPFFEGISPIYKGSISYRQGNPSKAQEHAEMGLSIFCSSEDLDGVIRSGFTLAQIHYSKSELNDAILLFKKCVVLENKFGNTKRRLSILSELSATLIALGNYHDAKLILDYLVKNQRGLSKSELVYIEFDSAHLNLMTGNLDEARKMIIRCADNSANIGYQVMTAAALGLRARIEEFLGNRSEAVRFCEESIDIQMKADSKEILLDTLCDLSHFYVVTGDFENASKTLEEAKDIAEVDGHELLIAQWNLYRIEYLHAQRYYLEARALLDEIHRIFLEKNDTRMLNVVNLSMVESLIAETRYRDAHSEIDKLIARTRLDGATVSEFQARIIKTAIYTKTANFDTARVLLETTLSNASSFNLVTFVSDADSLLNRIQTLESTLEHYTRADEMQASSPKKDVLSMDEIASYISKAKSVLSTIE